MELHCFSKRLSGLLVFLFVSPLLFAAKVESLIPLGNHCVAYKTEVTLFLFKQEEIIGQNCDIRASVKHKENMYFLELKIPVEKFNSGSTSRDEDVSTILHLGTHPYMVFKTSPMSKEALTYAVKHEDMIFNGTLEIGGKPYPLSASVKIVDNEVYGSIRKNYKDFGIEPPKVLGGLVAKAKDWVELHFRIQFSKTDGTEVFK